MTKIHYHDRYEGIPVHDEQGTHDRPHDLTVDFDHAKIDAALVAMGSRPWLSPRPRLLVVLGVRNAKRHFRAVGRRRARVLHARFLHGFVGSHRHADRPALARSDPARRSPTQAIGAAEPAALDALARQNGADQALTGTLEWSDERAAGSPSGGWPSPGRAMPGGCAASASTTPSAMPCAARPSCFQAMAGRKS